MILKALLHCALFHFFTGVLDTNMLVSKTPVKKREKSEKDTRKLAKARKKREDLSILRYALGKSVSQLRFSRV